MDDEEFVKKDCNLTDHQWKIKANKFFIRHGRKAKPWQIASGYAEPNEKYVQWIGRRFEGADYNRVAPSKQKEIGISPELIQKLRSIRTPDIPQQTSTQKQHEGRVFRGFEATAGNSALERKAAVDRIMENMEKEGMSAEGFFYDIINIVERVNIAAMNAGVKINFLEEIREWITALKAYIIPVAQTLVVVAPQLYKELARLAADFVLKIVPAITELVTQIAGKVGKEAIVYGVGGAVASPVGSVVIGVIL